MIPHVIWWTDLFSCKAIIGSCEVFIYAMRQWDESMHWHYGVFSNRVQVASKSDLLDLTAAKTAALQATFNYLARKEGMGGWPG